MPEEAKRTVTVKEEAITDVADDSAAGRAFVSLQGKMKMPVAGQLVGRFGKPRQQGVSWKGLFIQTANGTRCAAWPTAPWCSPINCAASATPS